MRTEGSFKQEIIFVTGKGGVGKSAVAAAMALARAQQGKKTLLVELGHQSFYKDYFNFEKISFKPTYLKSNLDVALWSGSDLLKEYALHLIKIEALYKIFFENPVSRALINIAPALAELAILGKLTSGYRRVGVDFDYDCVVVDAFATGHMLALLRAPKGFAEAVKFGPMGEQSRDIFDIIRDPKKTQFYVVSFSEELPVLEGIELSKGIEDIVGYKPKHILNKYINLPTNMEISSKGSIRPDSFMNYLATVNGRQQWALNQLMDSKKLPYILKTSSWDVVESLALEFLHD